MDNSKLSHKFVQEGQWGKKAPISSEQSQTPVLRLRPISDDVDNVKMPLTKK